MARQPRLHVRGGLYHVTLRGNHRQPIFEHASDRARLDSIVADAILREAAKVHAFCWMTNHIHLMVEVADAPLGRTVQRVASQYARYAQRRSATTGHFFERRYHAVLVDCNRYLLELVRYIHLNPVRGGLVQDPAEYPWSSHRDYLGLAARPWLETRLALSMLDADPARAQLGYSRYVAEAVGTKVAPPLQAVASGDRRVLGGAAFLEQIAPMPRNDRNATSLEELIEQACAEFSVPSARVRSSDRARHLTQVRTTIAQRAIDGGVATRSEVARALGRSLSAISQALERCRREAGTPLRRPRLP